jgi:hypothetical protein
VHVDPETLATGDATLFFYTQGIPNNTCVTRLSFPVRPWRDVPGERGLGPNPDKARRLAFFDAAVNFLKVNCVPGPKLLHVTGFWPRLMQKPARTHAAFDDGIARLNPVHLPTATFAEAHNQANYVQIRDHPNDFIEVLRRRGCLVDAGRGQSVLEVIETIFSNGVARPVDVVLGEVYCMFKKLRAWSACPRCYLLLASITPTSPNLMLMDDTTFDLASQWPFPEPLHTYHRVCPPDQRLI